MLGAFGLWLMIKNWIQQGSVFEKRIKHFLFFCLRLVPLVLKKEQSGSNYSDNERDFIRGRHVFQFKK